MRYAHLLPILVNVGAIMPKQTEPARFTYSRKHDPHARHVGHSIEDCYSFKTKVQELINRNLLCFTSVTAKEGLGRWVKTPGTAETSIRNLPPLAISDPRNLDAMGLLSANKGSPMEGIVEQVRDDNTIRVYLLPEFQFVQVFVSRIQAPQVGKRVAPERIVELEVKADEPNGVADPFAHEAKFFTDMTLLNRDVWIILKGVDKFNNLIGSVCYPDGESVKDLALELVENCFSKYVE
ncbi:hypothetical protein KIW84_044217 [Lathyrus oleraceus]|uniref:TNase-like domain-containing protein n=1 Tax=Pisum sativum TaxID=3888 RepID=A0A9D4XFP8_PEA|nr:hypothetical protein KIW84_044217 [Pisum sativum]